MNIEPLESRIAPATFTYADVDGDFVTIKTSKGTDAQLAVIITPFLVASGLGMELQEINFSAGASTFAGTTLSVTAKRTSTGGDGLVNVGYIDATDTDGGNALDLGVVTIKGDLGRINAGDATTATSALKGLSVRSMGLFGNSTQAIGGDLHSTITGALGFLKVFGTVKSASIHVVGGADGKIGSVTIGGSLLGAAGANSGSIFAAGAIGPVKIGGDMEGSGGSFTGSVASATTLASITVRGSLIGGGGNGSGEILASQPMGPVKIGGNIEGGGGSFAGSISSNTLVSISVGGSIIGGAGGGSGGIFGSQSIGPVKIGGNIKGGDINEAGVNSDTGVVLAERIASLYIGGSIIAGTESGGGSLVDSGAVRVEDDIGPITIKGSLLGNVNNPVVISARGQATPTATADVAIKSINIAGRVEFADILAGYDLSGIPAGVNADAQIGPVVVGGDWIASSLVAGVQDDATPDHDSFFGDADDQKITGGTDQPGIVSKIASILIKGTALGTIGTGNHFGFVAEQIGSFKIGTTKFPLTAGASNDLTGLVVGISDDLRVREV
jgi:hypothetical protein